MKLEFPINLPEHIVSNIIDKHFPDHVTARLRNIGGVTRASYFGYMHENGLVDIIASCSFEHGFVSGSTSLLDEHLYPFTESEVQHIISQEKYRIAEREYDLRENEKRNAAIRKLAAKLFSD